MTKDKKGDLQLKVGSAGLNLIKEFEGLRLVAYPCEAGVWTIGYGHTSGVKQGDRITEAQADAFLREDVVVAEAAVNRYYDIYHFNQNQFDALVSFAFNIGSIKQLTNNGTRSIAEISAKIPEYRMVNGQVSAGLERRRAAEKALFDTPVEEQEPEKESDNYMFECPVLGGGMSGNAVLLWQKLLAGVGYDLGEDGRAGNLSGVFNGGTYLATLDYKKHVGISIGADGTDGTVTKEVWKCMIGL